MLASLAGTASDRPLARSLCKVVNSKISAIEASTFAVIVDGALDVCLISRQDATRSAAVDAGGRHEGLKPEDTAYTHIVTVGASDFICR